MYPYTGFVMINGTTFILLIAATIFKFLAFSLHEGFCESNNFCLMYCLQKSDRWLKIYAVMEKVREKVITQI